MFEWLRRMIFPIIIIALAAFVALIVLEWGANMAGRQGGAASPYAAVINGEPVSWQLYNRTYEDLRRQQTQQTGEELTDAQARQVEEAAWNQILQDKLLMQEADKLNVSVSEEEVYQYLRYSPPPYLQTNPAFQTDGQFDYQKYMGAMLDPEAGRFWERHRPLLTADVKKLKVQHLVIQAAHVTEDEIRQNFIESQEKVSVGVVEIPQTKLQRLVAEPTDEEIKAYYDANSEEFFLDERAILHMVRLSKDPTEADWERALRMINLVADSVKAGADFAEMAKYYGEDGSAARGGDLNWFSADGMVDEFSDAVFSMKKGEVSEPVRTQFGWHLIKVHDFREETKVPRGKTEEEKVREAHASHILIKAKASAATLDAIGNRLDAFLTVAREDGFDVAATEAGLKVDTTMPFARNSQIQILGRDMAAIDFAFDSKIGTISNVRSNTAAYFVLQAAERIPEGIAPLEDVTNRIKVIVKREKTAELCRDTAFTVFRTIESGMAIHDAAKEFGFDYIATKPFARGESVRGIGRDPRAIGAAFSLKEVGQVSQPVDYTNGSMIIKLLDRQTPDLTMFNDQRDSLSSVILMDKQRELYSNWFQELIETADIENNIASLGQ